MRTMRVFVVLLAGSLAVSASRGEAPAALKEVGKQFGAPVLWVPKPSAPPTIDGQLDDACWNQAQPVVLGFSTGAWWDRPAQKTEARVLADEKAIYFGVRCFESEPDRVALSGTARKGMIVGADAVEFFLDPGCGRKRHEYFHVIVTANGTVYRARGLEPDGWKGNVTAKVGKFDGGWTVEAAVPLEELGLKADALPKVWGINVCRQRPELAFDMPKAARAAGNKRYDPPMWKLDEPEKYRLAEYTCWSPTYADFCGWPFYADSRPFHLVERFGHALLQVGTQAVAPPTKPFEILYKSEFANGKVGPFQNAALYDDAFRGPGKSLGFAEGQNRINFTLPLDNLDDVTILLCLKLAPQTLPVQHLSLTGKAPDGIWCGAERYEFFLPREEAETRTQFLEAYHKEKYGAGPFALYDTHADMVRWKPCGRVSKGPGPWAMVEGFFAEPSGGQVRWPGKDWVIVRIRPALFRRAPQPKQGQKLVGLDQNYPNGLTLTANPREGLRIDNVVVFRGVDTEPPEQVRGVKLRKDGDDLELTWEPAKDNTLSAFYRIYSGTNLVAESHQLTARLKASAVGNAPLTLVAVDLYGNASPPSEPVPAR
ncbi:hypothetical protein AYO44_02080 [Planctomycetaceae bacterium SCGC AG-212-F19]|nr:hypothetical protein AYO44_02080 [Planctomycetaceae bacterium SCGC AG-212-F19]